MYVNFCRLFRGIQSGKRPKEKEMVRDVECVKLQEHFAGQEGYQRQQLQQKYCPWKRGNGGRNAGNIG